jgi:hypothetical protein
MTHYQISDEHGDAVGSIQGLALYGRTLSDDEDADVWSLCCAAVHAVRRWTTWGSVRGMGPLRSEKSDAERDLVDDDKGCASQGGYSDRRLCTVDADGWVNDAETGDSIWPYGRTHRALRVAREAVRS